MSDHKPKLSIITAVYNQLPMNQIYWENLVKNTKNSFELIVIDNASTDASADFFESVGARVIRNPGNYSYPVSQNQGIAIAKGEWLAFLNNDIIVSKGWDETLIANAEHNQLDVITSCGIERIESKSGHQKAASPLEPHSRLAGFVWHRPQQLLRHAQVDVRQLGRVLQKSPRPVQAPSHRRFCGQYRDVRCHHR